MYNQKYIPLSVVIPTYNRKKILVRTIESLLMGEYIPDEIIVVDQSEVILDAKQDSRWDKVVKIFKVDIVSLTAARNVGVRKANNDIILFCDDDIEINEVTIKYLYEEMKKEDVSLISAVNSDDNAVYDYKEKEYRKLRNIAGYICGTRLPARKGGYIIGWSMKGHYSENMMKAHTTEWAYGFFFCVKKSLMEKWNVWFDENLIKYAFAEDMDFSCRYCRCSKEERLKTFVEPKLYVHHLVSKEWRMPQEEAILYGFLNRWYLSYKLFPKHWWYRIGMVWSDIWYTILVCRKRERYYSFKSMIRTYTKLKKLKHGIIER